MFQEEIYAIPHHVHHQRAEKSGDPYGPHLGWLGTYFSIESSQKFNTSISTAQYTQLKNQVEHIGISMNTYEEFKKSGSIEKIHNYFIRALFSQIIFVSVSYWIAGIRGIFTWYAAAFITDFLIRDFNWRAHGGNFRRFKKPGWEFDKHSYALNQHFYGFIASEWHDNHHSYPTSANNGFLPIQLDVAFQIIKFLKSVGIVDTYIDAKNLFIKKTYSCLPELI